MVRIACIVNPAGRDGTVLKRWPEIEALIEAVHNELELTQQRPAPTGG